MNYSIPLFSLNYGAEEEAAIQETLRSGWISMGPRVAEFEQAFGTALGATHAVAVTNCTAALHLALLALEIGPGDEVICPSLTFIATVNAIRYVGATPVFADIIGSSDLTIDPASVASLISPRTRAIMVMHYAGFPCRMDDISALAEAHGLQVIEDASHGPLSRDHDRCLGTIGNVGCFSFFSNKSISTGEGGMLVTGDAAIAERLRLQRSHGMTSLSYERSKGHATSYDVVALGYNYRMEDIRASLGLVQLKKLPDDQARRQEVRARYLSGLSSIDEVIVPFSNVHDHVSNYIFPIVLGPTGAGRREAVRAHLARKGIQTSVHYPAVHRFKIYQTDAVSLPRTDYAADNQITLPMYGTLRPDQVAAIIDAIKEALS